MKLLFLLLVLLNLAFFSAWHGWFGRDVQALVVPEQREPERLGLQVSAQRFVVLPDDRPDAAPAAAPAAPAAPAAAASAAPSVPALLACLEAGSLPSDEARRFGDRLAGIGPEVKVVLRTAPDAASYMVYLPPYPSKADADRAVVELRSRGVDDLVVIQDIASLRNGISLGVFRSEDAAKARIASLASRSISRASIALRPATPRSIVELHDLPPASRASIDGPARDAGAGEWHDCATRKG